ncbi:hypothetical protein RhiirA5_381008 [Rhizophagus irregularis]|uniref:Uncharacterized protein n=1 Tax=Rhizophagus irregularis TaxID=588596 RepID=A0A2N0P6D8_9GLOM|nr:hypothetical protein RhiirA5_381008 [Rhizophagus irregularis]CAB4486861.1 unnamed protein product [Rhizophagus irregularis]CAB5334900.1 unnamed protein product [Rhizophagus irregularis]
MEYENPEDNPMVESDKNDPILYSDKSIEYHDTNVEITLCSGMQFQLWEELEIHLNIYAFQEGFSYKKTRLEYYMSQTEMNNFTDEEKAAQIKRRTYKCSHFHTHTSKKVV